jgi:hypothetical protein
MTKLWQELTDELGSAFKNQYGMAGGTAFIKWSKELKEFDETQLVKGFEKFKNAGSTYMSLNIFRNHCKHKPEDLGLPDLETAYQQMIHGQWSRMPDAFRIVFGEHRYVISRMPEDQARKKFTELYKNTVQRIANGEVFEIKKRVEIEHNPSGTTHANNNGLTGKAALKSILGMMGSTKARD